MCVCVCVCVCIYIYIYIYIHPLEEQTPEMPCLKIAKTQRKYMR